MDESKRSGGTLRSLVVALALVLVVAAIWAASALAAGGSSSSSDSSRSESPAAGFVQDDGEAPNAEDCPERAEDADDSADASADV
jgi:hypothetical protein